MPELTEDQKGLWGADWKDRPRRHQFERKQEPETYEYQEYPKVVQHHSSTEDNPVHVTVYSKEHEDAATIAPPEMAAEEEVAAVRDDEQPGDTAEALEEISDSASLQEMAIAKPDLGPTQTLSVEPLDDDIGTTNATVPAPSASEYPKTIERGGVVVVVNSAEEEEALLSPVEPDLPASAE